MGILTTEDHKQIVIFGLQKQIKALQLDLNLERLQSSWLDTLANFHRDVNYDTWDQEDIEEAQNEVNELYQNYIDREKEVRAIKKELGVN